MSEENYRKLSEQLTELRKDMDSRFERLESKIDGVKSHLEVKLDKIDEDIRGNGKDGISIRLDRLENSKKLASRWFWFIVTAAAPTLIGTYLS